MYLKSLKIYLVTLTVWVITAQSVPGYTTGKVIKSQKDRQDYIDDFYAAHPDAPRPLSRYNSSTVYTAASSPQHHMGCRKQI